MRTLKLFSFLLVLPLVVIATPAKKNTAGQEDGSSSSPTLAGADIAREISQSLSGEKNLNTRNVRIIRSGNAITLKGSVATEADRATIERRAKEIALPNSFLVENRLKVSAR